jgi:hypothetical protein
MKIVVIFDEDRETYEINETNLNPKQIELIAHMLNIPKMIEAKEAE